MDVGYSQAQAQRVLKQRNLLGFATLGLALVAGFAAMAAASRDREVVLQPVNTSPLSISSRGVSRDYLELVTRDASVMMFNRSPASLQYWMESVLKIVHPSAYGKVKAELMKLANDQRGSSVAYFFTPERLHVEPDNLTSQVTGVLHTMVGAQEVSAIHRTYRFVWSYTGLELRLLDFGVVIEAGENARGEGPPASQAALGSDDGSMKVR